MTSCAGLAFISISISIHTPVQIPVLNFPFLFAANYSYL